MSLVNIITMQSYGIFSCDDNFEDLLLATFKYAIYSILS